MPNKRQGEEDHQNQPRRRRRRQKHLYVALDDWKKGFSIYKIDADSFNDSDNDDEQDLPTGGQLPLEPPVLRLEAPVGDISYGVVPFSALGTKIFAFTNQSCGLIYDTETAVLAIGPHAPAQMVCSFGTYMRVGEMLYALSPNADESKYFFFVMSWGPTSSDARNPTEGWSWKTLPSPPPAFNRSVTSYALHPDGCTIFVTTHHGSRMCTYSFDTKRSVWTWLGYWALPFLGQGHFDTELDAWVGLRLDGSVCSWQVVSPTPIKEQQLNWKMTQEKLAKDRILSNMFVTVSLTHMGRSKFCLVQSLARGADEGRPLGDRNGCVLHVTTFRLKYNHKGQLQASSKHHFTRSFPVSRRRNVLDPAVFWM